MEEEDKEEEKQEEKQEDEEEIVNSGDSVSTRPGHLKKKKKHVG